MFDAIATIPLSLSLTLLALFGLIVGSFLNVVIYRLPLMLQTYWQQECTLFLNQLTNVDQNPNFQHSCPYCQHMHSILPMPESKSELLNLYYPRSHCPICHKTIASYHNIPLLSYLWLRGRCADCSNPISPRYPIIEALTAVIFVLTALQFGFSLLLPLALILACSLLVLAVIDYDHQILPDNLTQPILWLGLGLNLFAYFTPLASAVIGALAGYLSLYLFAWLFKLITKKEGMGHGDFKLLALLGAWLGWQQLPFIILCASFIGAIIGLGLIFMGKQDRHKPLPFGPYLALAGFVALLYGDNIIQNYLQLARLA